MAYDVAIQIKGLDCEAERDCATLHRMQKYLFKFGFETPDEHLTNQRSCADHESSWGLWIRAKDEQEALSWGLIVADEFVSQLYERHGTAGFICLKSDFAHWIDDDATDSDDAEYEGSTPQVQAGILPDFSRALDDFKQ